MTTKVAPDVTGTNGAVNDIPQESQGLRRAVGVWGSYTWGYADVGADGGEVVRDDRAERRKLHRRVRTVSGPNFMRCRQVIVLDCANRADNRQFIHAARNLGQQL